MRKVGLRLMSWFAMLILPVQLLAAESSDAAVIVADSRKFSGWQAWWANVYNESHFWFALITVIILPVTALILGRLTGWFMARLGINLRSRELAEH
jgi:ABC-type spermidine/putrescine transport system permease subunit II